MMEKTTKYLVGCKRCEYHSRSLRRCKLGKANPPTRKGTVEVMRFGSTVCGRNQWAHDLYGSDEIEGHRFF